MNGTEFGIGAVTLENYSLYEISSSILFPVLYGITESNLGKAK